MYLCNYKQLCNYNRTKDKRKNRFQTSQSPQGHDGDESHQWNRTQKFYEFENV